MRVSYDTLSFLAYQGDVNAEQAAAQWINLFRLTAPGNFVVAWYRSTEDDFMVATARSGHKPWEQDKSSCHTF